MEGVEAKNGHPATEPQLRVRLWRPEAVTCVMEISEGLSVTRVDAAAALVFGVTHTQLLVRDACCCRTAGLACRGCVQLGLPLCLLNIGLACLPVPFSPRSTRTCAR